MTLKSNNMNNKRLELLAPAGDLETLKAVIDAGADAVYFGGDMFGARAYATNFSKEDAEVGIRYAKLFGRKTYLTVNTLIKNKEFDENLYSYLKFYYEAGIDAFLVQDFGLFKFIKSNFPGVEVHASTQISTSSKYGAEFLKKEGCDRVVLSRELSLDEIKDIYDRTGMDIEVFVHGAICVCYSGNCLMSSVLGGRSGNRGRCAQPCRLPYSAVVNKKSSDIQGEYLLSPKDMCLLSRIPELAEAGAFSLKIEGRMKNPTYAAGVTAIYRKYIDLYLETGKPYEVSKEDMQFLFDLGQRGNFTDLYLDSQNGPALMSFKDSSLHLNKNTVFEPKKNELNISANIVLRKNQESLLKVTLIDRGVSVTEKGDIVSESIKRPLLKEDVLKQIRKTGDSVFSLTDIDVVMDDDIFMPVSKLNELRRNAFSRLEEEIIESEYRYTCDETHKASTSVRNNVAKEASFEVSVLNEEQLLAIEGFAANVDKVIVHHSFLAFDSSNLKKRFKDAKIVLSLPPVFRKKSKEFFDRNSFADRINDFDMFLASSYDAIGYLEDKGVDRSRIYIDHRLYTFNNEAVEELSERGFKHFTSPLELNSKELRHRDNKDSSCIVYGRIPLMISANCTRKNVSGCDKKPGIIGLKDRKNIDFPVFNDCSVCMNTIYNSLPLNLYNEMDELMRNGFSTFRIDFTVENERAVNAVLETFINHNEMISFKCTKGHYNRGVE